jgi:predicted porin
MNNKLLAAAVASALAVPAVAFAQSSVTLYGLIDTGLRNQSKVIETATTDGTVSSVSNSLNSTNRWGMTGSEDLGGGLKANFTLEGEMHSDDGTGTTSAGGLNFQRKSVVGLSSGATSFDIGRDYTVNFKEFGIYDPMSYNYTGITPNVRFTSGVRSSNMITAATGGNGFNVRIDYAMGEQTGSTSAGSRYGVGGDFAVGGVKVGAAYSSTKNTSTTSSGSQKDATIGASYSMNGFTFKAGWAQTKWDQNFLSNGGGGSGAWYAAGDQATPTTLTATGQLDKARMYALGVGYAFSSRVTGRVGYYDIKSTGFNPAGDGKLKTTILDVTYSLSNRTNVYAEVDHTSLNGSAVGAPIDGRASNDGTTGLGVGLVHKF